jgi:hypothetical protein
MPLLNNYPLVAAMASIFISQVTKIPVAYFLKRPITITLMFSTGGMPSSHSAGVTALITAIVIEHGWNSPFTAISITFGVLVMFDSMGVRRQSGQHGIIINELIQEIQMLAKPLTGKDKEIKDEIENSTMQSTEFLGHKPVEVLAGLIYGIILSLLIYVIFYAN